MKRLAIVLLLLLSAVWVFAQEPLSGIVVNDTGKELAGANVMAYGPDGKVLSFAVTGADGTFQLKKTAGLEKITASFMGFKTVSIPAGQFKDGQQIRMEAGGFQLKEVAVTAERIKESGDTLTYSVGGFKQAQDRSIADVIGKMPGLEVKASGAIEYQGKLINKFYIEGMDLMGSQYALASENLSADKVKEDAGADDHHDLLLDVLLVVVHGDVDADGTDDRHDTGDGVAELHHDRDVFRDLLGDGGERARAGGVVTGRALGERRSAANEKHHGDSPRLRGGEELLHAVDNLSHKLVCFLV